MNGVQKRLKCEINLTSKLMSQNSLIMQHRMEWALGITRAPTSQNYNHEF